MLNFLRVVEMPFNLIQFSKTTRLLYHSLKNSVVFKKGKFAYSNNVFVALFVKGIDVNFVGFFSHDPLYTPYKVVKFMGRNFYFKDAELGSVTKFKEYPPKSSPPFY